MWRRKQREWSVEEVVDAQLAMNEQTWGVLRDNGVADGTELVLDFFFDAPGRDAAEQLAAHLREAFEYQVEADKTSVSGSTQPMAVTRELLDSWVRTMVAAGYEHGRCEFDGWGAEIP